jgi:hypothetical protein
MAHGEWCDVELDDFPPADFDHKGDRRWHARGLQEGVEPHFADGQPAESGKSHQWNPPVFDIGPEGWK